MNLLNSFERNILEIITQKSKSLPEITNKTGLSKKICEKILQDLVDKKILKTNGIKFYISNELNLDFYQEINSDETLSLEAMEYIEAILEFRQTNIFKFKKISISENDFKLLGAMLTNIDSFLRDAEKSFKNENEYSRQKVIFWGAGDLQKITNQMLKGAI